MSSIDWVPELAAALDGLVPLEDGSRADWDDVVGRVRSRRRLRFARTRPRRSLRLAIVVALLFLLLAGVATATYLLVRGNGGIALGGATRLLVVSPNGPGLHAVARCPAERRSCQLFQPAWSPDGTRLAFVRGPYMGPRNINRMFLYIAAADGGGARRLAFCGICGELQQGQHLAWSPDGKWIAFSRDAGPTGEESLWLVAAAGGRLRRLINCHALCVAVKPAWAPNGRLLVFERIGWKSGASGLYTIRSDGSGLKRIVAEGEDPQWSPNGHRIAFDNADGIAVANADGSHVHMLFAGTRGSGPGTPSWSPDGHRIVFFNTPGRPGHYRAELWTMNADGSGKERLYRSGCCVMYYAPPIWSPNGRLIAFSADSAGGTFVINADGTGLRRLSPLSFIDLSWQPLPKGGRK
jgi:Tol biopolymer transport system component